MAHTNVTEWKCDRCGKTQTTPTDPHADEQTPPGGWSRYSRKPLNPDNAYDEQERPRLPEAWEVCSSCDSQTARFLMNGSNTADSMPA